MVRCKEKFLQGFNVTVDLSRDVKKEYCFFLAVVSHLMKLLHAGRTVPNLTTLFLRVMNVAYVKSNPDPAPARNKKKKS